MTLTRQLYPHEWLAWDDERPDGPLGLGHSEESAIQDLRDQIEQQEAQRERSNAE